METQSILNVVIAIVALGSVALLFWLRALIYYYSRRQNRFKRAVDEDEISSYHNEEEIFTITGNLVKEFTDVPLTNYYVIQDTLLGRGSSAHVVIGVSKKSQRRYAIKAVDTSHVNIAWKYERELDILRLTDHTNIIRVYEMYRLPTALYFVMELCTGGHLGQVLKQQNDGCLDQDLARTYIGQICRALFHCHSQGIVHRDVKLQNILLESNGRDAQVKLVDFGNSARFSLNTLPLRKIVGTTYTAAPEVFKQEYDERCDIWSLGVVAYILLSGRRPFESIDLPLDQRSRESIIIANILTGRYHFLHESWEIINDSAIHFVKLCLEMDYTLRVSAEECLQHVWLSEQYPVNTFNTASKSDLKMRKDLYRNASSSGIRRATMLGVAYYMPNGKIQHLRSVFQRMDKSGRGYIEKHQFHSAMQELSFQTTSEETDLIFSAMDTSLSGNICFTEFVAATLDPREVDIVDLNRSFRLMDAEGKGYIDRNDLKRVLSIEDENSLSRQNSLERQNSNDERVAELNTRVRNMIDQVDMDKDGVISYTEFLFAMADGAKKRLQTNDVMHEKSKSTAKSIGYSRRQSDSAIKVSNKFTTRKSSISSNVKITARGQRDAILSSFVGSSKTDNAAVLKTDIVDFLNRDKTNEDPDDIFEGDFEAEKGKIQSRNVVPSIIELMWKDFKIGFGRISRRLTFRPSDTIIGRAQSVDKRLPDYVEDSESYSDDDSDIPGHDIFDGAGSRRLSSPALLWQSLKRRSSNFTQFPVPPPLKEGSNQRKNEEKAQQINENDLESGLKGIGNESVLDGKISVQERRKSIIEDVIRVMNTNETNTNTQTNSAGNLSTAISAPITSPRLSRRLSATGRTSRLIIPDIGSGSPDSEGRSSPVQHRRLSRSGRTGRPNLSADRSGRRLSATSNISTEEQASRFDHMSYMKSEGLENDHDESLILNIDALPAGLRSDMGLGISLTTRLNDKERSQSSNSEKMKQQKERSAQNDDGSFSYSNGGSDSTAENKQLEEFVNIIRYQQSNGDDAITPEEAIDLAEKIQLFQSGPYADPSTSMEGSKNNSSSMPTIFENDKAQIKNANQGMLNNVFNAFLKGLSLGRKQSNNQILPEMLNNNNNNEESAIVSSTTTVKPDRIEFNKNSTQKARRMTFS
jgi:calcium-dependent protein kinase